MISSKPILYPAPILREVCQPVTVFDAQLEEEAKLLTEAMIKWGGCGLAACQANLNKQMIVVWREKKQEAQVFINPEILFQSSIKRHRKEGCLSLPGIRVTIARSYNITIRASNLKGEVNTFKLEGMSARITLHEYEHIVGKLIIDHAQGKEAEAIKDTLAELEENAKNTHT